MPRSGKVVLVAIGSSSTSGFAASSMEASYPSVLQKLLGARADLATFQVFNKGVNGDTLVGTEARLKRDVLDLDPQVVVLQTGTNDAINAQGAAALDDFRARLRSVVSGLKSTVPVILMNGQHYPTQPPNYLQFQNVIAEISAEQDVPLFDRYGLMQSWIDSRTYTFSQILAPDAFHPNDFTYRCMAEVIFDLVESRTRSTG